MFSIFGLFGPNLHKMYTERAVDVNMPSLLKDVGILEHGTACKAHAQRNLSKHAVKMDGLHSHPSGTQVVMTGAAGCHAPS